MTFKHDPKRLKLIVRLTAAALVTVAVLGFGSLIANHCGLRWNSTASLPRGYYRITPTGKLVGFCPDAAAATIANTRRYRPEGECPDGFAPLLKPVAARPGDSVTVGIQGIRINGRLLPNTRQFPYDRQHRPLPLVPAGTYSVAPGTIWVLSTHSSASYDSRYYGPIQLSEIVYHADPFLTF